MSGFLLAAGGTGGHMFPALAVAEALRRDGRQVTLVTDRRGERWTAGEPGAVLVPAASPSGSLANRLAALLELARGTFASLRLFRRLRPAVAATFGGYASVPAALAALATRTPLVVHEQNALLGRANRMLARRARVLLLSFERTAGVPAGVSTLVSGNPVRRDFVAGERAADGNGSLRLLVIGGSQGARILSEVVPAAIGRLDPSLRARLRIAQQARAEDLAEVRAAYARLAVAAEVATFFEDIAPRMGAADLVVSRAGASSIAELLATGRPSVLVPYLHAADDHQTYNAGALADAGAAVLIAQPDFTPQHLAAELSAMLSDHTRLAAMARAAGRMRRPDAAERIAAALGEVAQREGSR